MESLDLGPILEELRVKGFVERLWIMVTFESSRDTI